LRSPGLLDVRDMFLDAACLVIIKRQPVLVNPAARRDLVRDQAARSNFKDESNGLVCAGCDLRSGLCDLQSH